MALRNRCIIFFANWFGRCSIPSRVPVPPMADFRFILFVTLCGIMLAAFVLTIYHCVTGRPPAAPPGVDEPAEGVEFSTMLLIPPPLTYGKGEGMVSGGETVCPVCLCEFKEGGAVRQLPECVHYFHVPCIDMWFRSHSNCPVCRTETPRIHQRGGSNTQGPRINLELIETR